MYFDVINTDKSEPEALTGVPYDKLTIGVPKEIHEGERRVALSPEAAKQLTKEGFKVVVEAGAGAGAKFLDSDYIAAGAEVKTVKDALGSDIVFKVSGETNSVIDSCSLSCSPYSDLFSTVVKKSWQLARRQVNSGKFIHQHQQKIFLLS